MSGMVEVKVAHLGVERNTNTPIVVLQEKEGDRLIPIYIGQYEANAIAMELADMKFERPLTHDLLQQVIVGLGAELSRVLLTRVEKSTYYAELELRRDDHVVQIDARPSDSIAVALRLEAFLPVHINFEPTNLKGFTTGSEKRPVGFRCSA